jgi:hypothetical protein
MLGGMENDAVVPGAPAEAQETIRYAGDKTFYIDDNGYWVDSEFDGSNLEPVEIKYLSGEYYQLIADEPDIAEYLGVGDKVIVVFDDKTYKIVPNDEAPSAAPIGSVSLPSDSGGISSGSSWGLPVAIIASVLLMATLIAFLIRARLRNALPHLNI